MKIMLTGSTGFLGKQILDALSVEEVTTVGRANCNIDYNFTEPVSYLPSVDLVIHSAGKAHSVPKSELQKSEFFRSNLTTSINLLHSLERSGIPKYFLFISSVAVYGLNEGILVNENFPSLANDPYGESKIAAENFILEWCKKHDVVCTILRLPLLVGSNPPGNLGAMIRSIEKGYYFNIDGGKAKKSMVLAFDVAMILVRASLVGGTYNLTDGYHPTICELSKNIGRQFGKFYIPNLPKFIAVFLANMGNLIGDRFPINSIKLAKITSTLTFDDSKARAAFGWNPTPVLKGFNING